MEVWSPWSWITSLGLKIYESHDSDFRLYSVEISHELIVVKVPDLKTEDHEF